MLEKQEEIKVRGVGEKNETKALLCWTIPPTIHSLTHASFLFFSTFKKHSEHAFSPLQKQTTLPMQKKLDLFPTAHPSSVMRLWRTGEGLKKMNFHTVICSYLFDGEWIKTQPWSCYLCFARIFAFLGLRLLANKKFQLAKQIAKGVKLHLIINRLGVSNKQGRETYRLTNCSSPSNTSRFASLSYL